MNASVPMIDLSDKRIVITGGGAGLGADMAAQFASLGARVCIGDIDAAAAEATAARLGSRAVAVACDIADEKQVSSFAASACKSLGRIDALINNAAHTDVAADVDLLGTDPSVWDQTMAVNLRGTMLVSRAILPAMIESGGGAVVTVVSRQGLAPPLSARRVAYGTSKAALIMLARHIAVAYGKKGIRSNALAPGTIATERMLATLGAERLAQSRANVLTPWLGEPADVSRIAAFLVSDAGRYITGQTIQVDGGVLTGLHE